MRWKRESRLRLVNEAEASPRVREIFAEVRDRLGLPLVPPLYQAYAVFPDFLELHWQSFRPLLESRQFYLLGARLAAECYTRAHNYFTIDNLAGAELDAAVEGALPLAQVLDYYQYLDPLLLLVAAAQMQAFEGAAGPAAEPTGDPRHPAFPVAPRLLRDGEATTVIQRIWGERRRVLELAFISDEHRALACWPNFYQQYWRELKSLLQSPMYADCQYRIGESAMKLAGELPIPADTTISQLVDAGVDNDSVYALVHLNAAFMQALTGLLLDVTFARIGLEGGNRNQRSPEGKTPDQDTLPPAAPVASEQAVPRDDTTKQDRTPTRAA